jgi:hypothetical protein
VTNPTKARPERAIMNLKRSDDNGWQFFCCMAILRRYMKEPCVMKGILIACAAKIP